MVVRQKRKKSSTTYKWSINEVKQRIVQLEPSALLQWITITMLLYRDKIEHKYKQIGKAPWNGAIVTWGEIITDDFLCDRSRESAFNDIVTLQDHEYNEPISLRDVVYKFI